MTLAPRSCNFPPKIKKYCQSVSFDVSIFFTNGLLFSTLDCPIQACTISNGLLLDVLIYRRARNTVKKLNGNSDNNGGGQGPEVEAAEPEAEEAAAAQARADAAAAEIKQATQEAAATAATAAEDSVIEVSVSEEPTKEASGENFDIVRNFEAFCSISMFHNKPEKCYF